MEQLGLDAIDASWAPENEKATLRTAFASEHARLRADHAPPRAEGAAGP
jgi:hypothetical protein